MRILLVATVALLFSLPLTPQIRATEPVTSDVSAPSEALTSDAQTPTEALTSDVVARIKVLTPDTIAPTEALTSDVLAPSKALTPDTITPTEALNSDAPVAIKALTFDVPVTNESPTSDALAPTKVLTSDGPGNPADLEPPNRDFWSSIYSKNGTLYKSLSYLLNITHIKFPLSTFFSRDNVFYEMYSFLEKVTQRIGIEIRLIDNKIGSSPITFAQMTLLGGLLITGILFVIGGGLALWVIFRESTVYLRIQGDKLLYDTYDRIAHPPSFDNHYFGFEESKLPHFLPSYHHLLRPSVPADFSRLRPSYYSTDRSSHVRHLGNQKGPATLPYEQRTPVSSFAGPFGTFSSVIDESKLKEQVDAPSSSRKTESGKHDSPFSFSHNDPKSSGSNEREYRSSSHTFLPPSALKAHVSKKAEPKGTSSTVGSSGDKHPGISTLRQQGDYAFGPVAMNKEKYKI